MEGPIRARRGDDTQQFKRRVESELAPIVKNVRMIWVGMVFIAGVAGSGWLLRGYVSGYAKNSDIKTVVDSIDAVTKKIDNVSDNLNAHILVETSRMARIETRQEDHAAWNERQLVRIAEKMKVPKVPLPPPRIVKPIEIPPAITKEIK
jgi:hypothetical protein